MKTASSSKLLQKHRFAVGAVVLALVFAAAAFYRSGETSTRETTLADRTTEGERLQANIKYSVQLKDQMDTLSTLNTQIEERLVNPAQLGDNLQFFYRIEAATNTKITDLRQLYTPAPQKAKTRYVSVPYSAGVQGDFTAVMDFLRKLEKSPRFSRVTSASLLPSAGSLSADTVTLNLSVELLGTP